MKPAGAKVWASKVDWAAADKVDPSAVVDTSFRLEQLDEEVKAGLEHDALIGAARAKAAEFAARPVDRINIHNWCLLASAPCFEPLEARSGVVRWCALLLHSLSCLFNFSHSVRSVPALHEAGFSSS